MNSESKLKIENHIASLVAAKFHENFIPAQIRANTLIIEGAAVSIEFSCSINSASDITKVRLDVYFSYGFNPIIESFIGIGQNLNDALNDVMLRFLTTSFETLVDGLIAIKASEKTVTEIWNIKGLEYKVFLGNIGTRGKLPPNLNNDWFDKLRSEIEKLNLKEGVNSIRFFYSHHNFNTTSCEVLLNNEPHIALLEKLASHQWPSQSDFYSLRLFLILRGGLDLERFIKILVGDYGIDHQDHLMKQMGISKLDEERAMAFIPEAFGRKFIQDMGAKGTFSNQVLIINAKEEQFEVNLDTEKLFVESNDIVQQLTKNGWSDPLKNVAFLSASVSAVNQALNEGAKIHDIDCGNLATLFVINSYNLEEANTKKSFWKFWK
jgi:hypothetical protein